MRKEYYSEMIQNDRAIPIVFNNKLCGIITYILCNSLEEVKGKNPWESQKSEGNIFYLEQIILDIPLSFGDSIRVFNSILNIVKAKHPEVKKIFWKHFNRHTNKLNIKELNLSKERCNYVYN
ncbi:hypothetical protein M0R04_11905 [Candidatus Dojkabacteria bacterium]|jgi:hypothetical protein|nr:hypothetical protein [Candidatus Dojkabacteria bacterium]